MKTPHLVHLPMMALDNYSFLRFYFLMLLGENWIIVDLILFRAREVDPAMSVAILTRLTFYRGF